LCGGSLIEHTGKTTTVWFIVFVWN
jgi:hypothetical protein